MTRLGVSPLRCGPAEAEVPIRVAVAVERQPRHPCISCRRRRVLYRIEVLTNLSVGVTEARCAPCWGIRA